MAEMICETFPLVPWLCWLDNKKAIMLHLCSKFRF